MDAKAIKRLRQLLCLAVDSGAAEAEARTAAMLVCRMLTQHNVLDWLDELQAKAAPTKTPASEDYWDDYDQREPEEHEEQEERAKPAATDERKKWRLWLRIDSKFPSRCYWCEEHIEKGEDILWDPGTRKCVCARCREQYHQDKRAGRI